MMTHVTRLLDDLPDARGAEVFTPIVARSGVRVERIVSHGQVTPPDAPFVQDWDEWVVVLSGSAAIRIGEGQEIALAPGDSVMIAAGEPHWVTRTAPDRPTVWLAVHFGGYTT